MAAGIDALKVGRDAWTSLGRGRMRLLAALVSVVATAQIAWIVRAAVRSAGSRDPLLSPFLTPDSPDWLSAGLEMEGLAVICGDRPPLMPGVYAMLDRLHAWGAIPTVHQLFFQLLVLAVAWLAWQATREAELVLLSALVTQLNGTLWYRRSS